MNGNVIVPTPNPWDESETLYDVRVEKYGAHIFTLRTFRTFAQAQDFITTDREAPVFNDAGCRWCGMDPQMFNRYEARPIGCNLCNSEMGVTND